MRVDSRKAESVFARTIAVMLVLAAVACATDARTARAADTDWDPRKVEVPELRPVRVPKPERLALPNGAVIYLLENHELPVVSGTAYFPMGPELVPNEKVGLASLLGEVMRSGGSASHAGDWLDDRLGQIGASVNSSVSSDLASSSFRCLTENTAEVIGLWAELLRGPAFPDDKIELSKVGLRRAIASRNDEMLAVLGRVANQAVFGKDHPNAREPEYATVDAIAREDCRVLHGRVFVPNRMVAALYGDFRSADVKKWLSGGFGGWAKSSSPTPQPAAAPGRQPMRIVFAPKDDVTQSGIVVAEPGSRADDPDYAALQVLETALGGGFQSRLFNRIRTQRGLAYATGASAGIQWRRPGTFLAYSLTKSESTMVAFDLLREELRRLIETPLTAAELLSAKQSVQNNFVFNFEQPAQVLFRSAFYEVNGYPADFLDRYQQSLARVDATSVLEAARRKIHPSQQVAVIVGKEKDFDQALDSAGLPVERIDIAIPPPASKVAAAPASPQAAAKGRAWLDRAAALAGGRAAWTAVKGAVLEQSATLSMQGQQLSLTGRNTWVFPDRQLEIQTLSMGEMRSGVNGASAWRSMMGQVQDDPKGAASLAEEWERSLWNLFGPASGLEALALDAPIELNGKPCAAALIKGGKVRDLTLMFAADGKLAGIAYQGEGPQGPARLELTYSDWRAHGAIQYPHGLSIKVDDQPFLEAKLTGLTLDPEVDPGTFKKPGS
ncbi:MAG: insulinase family protein [Candidatus Eisenbacteria bacterium]|uniref:Insulinase family protein n=1 Tax=Eiseniibacteriota bacterium TaxID=2212470 RepID=A0A849SLZ9_UNCEI|nr:insulinase family protein [Candidatus Eisenbacteria bacterium]